MNASGKSSLMKAVGITVILAQAGCYVPCQSFSFVPFKSLFTRILNTDNLWAGLSSFAVEMTELREILDKADKNSLVLGDELCSGTESVSATAIVGAGLQWLHTKSAKFIFATHLHGLINIPSVISLPCMKTWHLKVRYDPIADRLIYERTLTPGPGSSLYGLEVARAMNLPEEVLQIAQTIRRTLLGTANDSEAIRSHWNSGIALRKCELCFKEIVKDLEVHHIRHRKDTVDGIKVQDHVRNLIVVCVDCHDKHHAGHLEIGPLVQTSDGQVRLSAEEVTTKKKSESSSRSKWSEEQIQCIKIYLKTYPNSPPKRAIFDLQEQGITISASSLGKFR
jgi:DNA mismatch repair protein MutS